MAATDETTRTRIAPETMRTFMERMFTRLGVPASDAATAVDVLMFSDLHGIDSHGIPRMRMYTTFLRDGRVNLHPQITTVAETAATLTLDGDNGLGLVVGPEAMRRCIAKAQESGWCTVSVRASNHFGAASYYPMMAVAAGMGGMSMTNAGPLMVPTFGMTPMLGTNPLSIAFPGGNSSDPFLLDMASTSVAWGKIEIAKREGKPIPHGWALNTDGEFVTDPNEAISLAPLGSDRDHSSHKGYGLAASVDLFSAILSGGAWSKRINRQREDIKDTPIGTCHCFMAWRIDAFGSVEQYRDGMDDFMSTLAAAEPAPGRERVLVAGQPEFESLRDREANGVPLHESVRDDLRTLAAELDVPYDLK